MDALIDSCVKRQLQRQQSRRVETDGVYRNGLYCILSFYLSEVFFKHLMKCKLSLQLIRVDYWYAVYFGNFLHVGTPLTDWAKVLTCQSYPRSQLRILDSNVRKLVCSLQVGLFSLGTQVFSTISDLTTII